MKASIKVDDALVNEIRELTERYPLVFPSMTLVMEHALYLYLTFLKKNLEVEKERFQQLYKSHIELLTKSRLTSSGEPQRPVDWDAELAKARKM